MKAAKQLLAPKKHKDLLGKVPTVEEAKDLLEQAGCKPVIGVTHKCAKEAWRDW
jgi:hypothetical protein